jgi:hypothetical protein
VALRLGVLVVATVHRGEHGSHDGLGRVGGHDFPIGTACGDTEINKGLVLSRHRMNSSPPFGR